MCGGGLWIIAFLKITNELNKNKNDIYMENMMKKGLGKPKSVCDPIEKRWKWA